MYPLTWQSLDPPEGVVVIKQLEILQEFSKPSLPHVKTKFMPMR
jgi:hypothetical protein